MRTNPISAVLKLAGTIAGNLVSSNFIMDVAAKNHYSYADYQLLCKCLSRAPMTDTTYMAHVNDHAQLELMEIY